MPQIRVLHVLNNLGNGGAESFVMNIYRNVDRSKVQFDFLIRSKNNNQSMIHEIECYGGKVFILPPFPKRMIRHHFELKSFFAKNINDYAAIHVHANALIYVAPLKLAKKYGVSKIIIHSHSTSSKFTAIHHHYKSMIHKWVTDQFACSDLAAKWMFGDDEYVFIPNGVNIDLFAFNGENRNEIRQQYHIKDEIVFGTVGRFSYPKNHKYLLRVFHEIKKTFRTAKLLLVGDGELADEIRQLAEELEIKQDVLFAGAVRKPDMFYSAMDYFLLPSHFEGLPMALIEAQVNGLPVFVSDAVTTMAKISNEYVNICVQDSAAHTADTIICHINNGFSRESVNSIDTEKYNVQHIAKRMEMFYLGEN